MRAMAEPGAPEDEDAENAYEVVGDYFPSDDEGDGEDFERPVTEDEVRRIVGELVDDVRWQGMANACLCPMGHEATLWTDKRFPYVQCFHQKCQPALAEVNAELKARLRGLYGERGLRLPATPEEKARAQEGKIYRAHTRGVQHTILPQLMALPPVTEAQWRGASPFRLANYPVESQWRLFVAGMFVDPREYSWREDYHLWIGERYESECPANAANYQRPARWIEMRGALGPLVSQGLFKGYLTQGKQFRSLRAEGARKREWIADNPYFVAEADGIRKDKYGNVIRYLQGRGHRLRAIVDTGNKSLHAWFDRLDPPPRDEDRGGARYTALLSELWARLEGLGCDPGMFRPESTARLPGWPRAETDKMQRLIYYDPHFPIAPEVLRRALESRPRRAVAGAKK